MEYELNQIWNVSETCSSELVDFVGSLSVRAAKKRNLSVILAMGSSNPEEYRAAFSSVFRL